MPEEPWESWCIFRLFLSELEDAEIETVYRQFHHERAARQERDNDATRLLFSSLSASDLERAGEQIVAEQRARVEDLRRLERIMAADTSATTSTKRTGAGAGNEGLLAGAKRQARAEMQPSAPQAQISLACGGRQRDECEDRGRRRGAKEKRTKMTAFTISDDNNITVCARNEEVVPADDTAALVFDSKAALASLSAAWPRSRLVEIYNGIAGHRDVQKFANRNQAVTRIWEAVQPLAGNAAVASAPPPQSAPKGREASKPRQPAPKRPSAPAQKTPQRSGPVRDGRGKKAAVMAMLKRAKGVTLAEIVAATGWQQHTVRGFVSILSHQGGEKVESTKNAAGARTYRIAK